MWSPLGSPPHRALTWVPVCCEGHLVTPLLGSCNPGPSVSAASVAFPRKGGWAEAMSSASLSSKVARSGGWSRGQLSWPALVQLSCRWPSGQFSPCSRPSERVGWCLLSRLRSALKYVETQTQLSPPGALVRCGVGVFSHRRSARGGLAPPFSAPCCLLVLSPCSLSAVLCLFLLPVLSVIGLHLMGLFCLVACVFPHLGVAFWAVVFRLC